MRCRIKCVYRRWLGRCKLKSLKNVAVPSSCPRIPKMKFKVLKVHAGMFGHANVDVEYGDGRKSTFAMGPGDDIVKMAKADYECIVGWAENRPKALKHAKQFEGKEFSFDDKTSG